MLVMLEEELAPNETAHIYTLTPRGESSSGTQPGADGTVESSLIPRCSKCGPQTTDPGRG